ncbi:MAG: hypothetical protein PHY48_12100 [Candidatus Cloacimonetes bacterium]|jgi:hypothetical protein|nr:hypothetical protein [Candidatus Cloacimonadota bacterium]
MKEVLGQTCQMNAYVKDLGKDIIYKGPWIHENGSKREGLTVVQCKHSSDLNKKLTPGLITKEIEKIKELNKIETINTYILMTNMEVTGKNEASIRKSITENVKIENVDIFANVWLNQTILESCKLRMMVPRIYGLGDLSQILDERLIEQSKEILSRMGDDLKKYVLTSSYIQALNAIQNHNIVMLLGEPMCGKSTIAALLCMSMLDKDKYCYMQVTSLDEMKYRWNPHEKQLFWLDDVFGSTSFRHQTAEDMNKLLNHISTMIKKGAKIIFTSRTYIYYDAKKYIKPNIFEVLNRSELVINVQAFTIAEREQILYNHIKYGDQDVSYKSSIKPFLESIAKIPGINPEISRRLGSAHFTSKLMLDKDNLTKFITQPAAYLYDTIKNLDNESIAALVLLFAHNNKLTSPVDVSEDDISLIKSLTENVSKVKNRFDILNGDFILRIDGSHRYWKFKHPTFIEAVARYVSQQTELYHIFIKYSPLKMILNEVTCEGSSNSIGKMILTESLYGTLIGRMAYKDNRYRSNITNFLAFDSDDTFLKLFYDTYPKSIGYLHKQESIEMLRYSKIISIDRRLHHLKLLDEYTVYEIYEYISECTYECPDASILVDKELQDIIGEELFKSIIDSIEDSSFLLVEGHVSVNKDFYLDGVVDYSGELDFIENAYIIFYEFFEDVNPELSLKAKDSIRKFRSLVEEAIDENRQAEGMRDDGYDQWKDNRYERSYSSSSTSVFSDIDQ